MIVIELHKHDSNSNRVIYIISYNIWAWDRYSWWMGDSETRT